MSKRRVPLAEATRIAEVLLVDLEPHCERLAVAGSLRRRTPEVGDIELVAIPRMVSAGLFGTERESALWAHLQTSEHYRFLMGAAPQARYHRLALRRHGDVQLDVFIATPDNWGWIYLLRTGPEEFGKRILRLWAKQHDVWPASVDGRLVRGDGIAVATPEEGTIFARLGIAFVAPEDRG